MNSLEWSTAVDALSLQHQFWHSNRAPAYAEQLAAGCSLFLGRPSSHDIATMFCSWTRHADCYYVAPYLEPLLSHGAATLPDCELTADLLPSECGWLYFAEGVSAPFPPASPAGHSLLPQLRGIGWRVLGPTTAPVRCETPGVLLQVYFDCARCPRPDIVVLEEWPLGQSWRAWNPDLAWDVGRRYFLAFLLFVQQRLLVSRAEPVHRAVRRRAEREQWREAPMVRVVQLRRAQQETATATEQGATQWTCQWMVSGHWRQQPFGAKRAARRPQWIAPYVKGPEDKPLRSPSARVFAVVR